MMNNEISNPFPDNECFFCGCHNQYGLQLKFYWDEERQEVTTQYRPEEYLRGQGKILHGGIQSGILDEIMGWTSFLATNQMAVTTELKLSFLKPVLICGKAIQARCKTIRHEGNKVYLEASLTNNDNIVCTTATGIYHVLSAEKYQRLIEG